MDPKLKKILHAVSLDIRRLLEGRYDEHGQWQAGDLERRLNEIGIWREDDRKPKPLEELPHLSAEDKAARRLVDGYLKLREEADVPRSEAVAEFVREAAYTWANRLFALRCMEARGVIDEVVLQKAAYGGRSMVHNRFAKKNPEACAGEDDGLFAVLFAEFTARSAELPGLFDPQAPAVALRPSVAALKKTIALLSGNDTARSQESATDEVFSAPDAFGWAYQYYQDDEKERVDRWLKTKKGFKCEGADIIPKTALYTESYMVKFLVQNSLGALWMGMYPDSNLCGQWEYFIKDADRAPVTRKPVREITFLDPAQGSGHFHLEAFNLFYAMYEEEAKREDRTMTARETCAEILNHNLHGIDIDARSVQIGMAALWMKAKERAPDLEAGDLASFHEHLVATNIRLPQERNHLELFLKNHPEDEPLRPALELVFQGLEHADELGSLLQIEELVDAVLRRLKEEADKTKGMAIQPGLFEKTLVQGTLPENVEDYGKWKSDALERLKSHFEAEAGTVDAVQAFFGESAGKGLALFNLLARRYDVVAANPPYIGSKSMGPVTKTHIQRHFATAKRDVYLAFILRCIALAKGGRVALVTQQSWMFLKQVFKLRRFVLDSTALEVIGHLGAGAFAEISGGHVNVALFVASCTTPKETSIVSAIRATAMTTPEGKRDQLLQGCSVGMASNRYRVAQSELRALPTHTLVYWCSLHFLGLLRSVSTIDRTGYVGYTASANSRFIRLIWETANQGRWVAYSKGGGFCRWAGLEHYVVDWATTGQRVASHVREHYAPDKFTLWVRDQPTNRPTIVWSEISSGSLGARLTAGRVVVSRKGPGIFPNDIRSAIELLACLNTHLLTYLLRLSCSGLEFAYPYVAKTAFPPSRLSELRTIAESCIALKRNALSHLLTEPSFRQRAYRSVRQEILIRFATDAAILTLEARAEELTGNMYELDKQDLIAVRSETGVPVGEFPLVPGYDQTVPLGEDISTCVPEIAGVLEDAKRFGPGGKDEAEFALELRQVFERGPGTTVSEEIPDAEENEEEEEEEPVVGARIPIPPASFLEHIAQKLEVHPVSVYWRLKEGIENEGWRCPAEEWLLTGDRSSELVLRLLGHRWPKQLEANEPLPEWADQDGVIPLTSGGGETPLIDRLRKRLAADFPGGNVAALQQEFSEMAGLPLEQWLAGPFFEHHISQFRKRPIAWQLETEARALVSEGKGKKKRGLKSVSVFSCLVYYHKLDADLLPKIRTQYVGTLRTGYETELRNLEKQTSLTPEQQTRRLRLDPWIAELKVFDAKLEQVSVTGFGPESMVPALRQYAVADALLSLMACWLKKLNGVIEANPLKDWLQAADKTNLHVELSTWVGNAFQRLDYFCAAVGPKVPEEKLFTTDPTSEDLAPLVCSRPDKTVSNVLELACERWWHQLDEVVLDPLKAQLKQKKEELDSIKEELKLDEVRKDYERAKKLADRQEELKRETKTFREEIDEKTDKARQLRKEIESWTCPEAATWERWLGTQPLFDTVASLDGQRPPPQTIAEFITQESRYAPDINDGVRVNIAPIQKAGLLHADVLDSKDADKAIADRAEWRADERRWVRKGKLPQPGWWAPKEAPK